MSIQSFFLRKMLENKLKGLTQSDRQRIFQLVEKNPDFFQKMAKEVQDEMKSGKDQTSTIMEVVKKYENDLKSLLN
jgi:hypothetical protein